jgi:broad specificity phosphatase PhoE
MIELVYETHSVSLDNDRGIATGWLPGELSRQGRELARALGKRRRNDGIAAVFSSDLRRASQTAEIALASSGIPINQDARLRECDYGELNGAPRERVEEIRLECIDRSFPGGESYLDVVRRTHEFVGDLLRDRDGSRVLVIAHSANLWALEYLVEGASLAEVIAAPFDWQPGWEYVIDGSKLDGTIL